MNLRKNASKTLITKAEELLKKNIDSLQELSPQTSPVEKIKQLTLINQTVRLVQASRRMDNSLLKTIFTFLASILTSGVTAIIVSYFLQQFH